ncbi:MAG TPA: right-handed parallel beta-helix repeat-containing protein [Candidatus Dormibacteraeota bacterium]|nr:right-handed parallel beta-helix repeat-containing protein [Candidatus Dormibacteraeota bacterium]
MSSFHQQALRIFVVLTSFVCFDARGGDGPRLVAARTSMIFYVDSRDGDDANAGSSSEASWKTLGKVNATTFQPGDRILLKSSSVWSGQLWPKGSGVEGKPITVGMYGGGVKPVINGGGLFEDAVLLNNQEYWEIENLEVTNTGTTPAVRRGVHIALENYGEAHHIYIRSMTIHDVNGVDSVKPNGGIHYTSVGDKKPSRFIDLRIEDNEIYHVDRSGIFGWSDSWVRSKWFPSLGVIVRGNRLHDIGGDGIVVVATDGAVVEYNVVGHANQRSEGYNVAIWAWSADNTVIQHNEAYGTKGQRDGEGYDSDWNSRNTVIQYNYSHDNDGGFLLICNEGGHSGEESVGNSGTVVRYNISQNDRTRGINIAGPVTDSLIYNNTIYVGTERTVDLVLFSDWHGWSESSHFYNNIFYVAGTARFSYAISRGADGAYVTAHGFGASKDNVFDANVYYGVEGPDNDSHALRADPKLVAPGQGSEGLLSLTGYRLQQTSPSRKRAISVEKSGGYDFWGNAVPSCGATDQGAFQSDECNRARSGPGH